MRTVLFTSQFVEVSVDWLESRLAWQKKNSSWQAEGNKVATREVAKQHVAASEPPSVPYMYPSYHT